MIQLRRLPPRRSTSGLLHRATKRAGFALGFSSLLGTVLGTAVSAQADCDVIPGPTNQFRAALGTADRPYAGPGEFVDVKLRPEVCDRASLGLKNVASPSILGPEDVAVTVLFTPPNDACHLAA